MSRIFSRSHASQDAQSPSERDFNIFYNGLICPKNALGKHGMGTSTGRTHPKPAPARVAGGLRKPAPGMAQCIMYATSPPRFRPRFLSKLDKCPPRL